MFYRRQEGVALLVAVILALVLGLTCMALVMVSTANATSSQNSLRRAVALTLSEIGVERVKSSLDSGTYNAQFANQDHQATEQVEVHTPDGNVYGDYAVHVTENYGGVNNQYLVRSMGTTGQTSRQIEVVLHRVPAEAPEVLAAISLYNPNLLANFSGTPPYVCGLDTKIPTEIPFADLKDSDCVAGSGDGPDVVGIAVHDSQSVTDIISALTKDTERVVGTDGADGSENPSVYDVTQPNPTGRVDTMSAADVVELAQQYDEMADYVYDSHNWLDGEGQPVGGSFGTISQPRVVSIRNSDGGTLNMTGNLAGVGVLVIDCDVRFGGTFNYAGLILITNRGNATVDVDLRGTPLILGAMLAANAGQEAVSVLDLRGTADVFYSRDGLALAAQALSNQAGFTTKAYVERKPNASDFEIN